MMDNTLLGKLRARRLEARPHEDRISQNCCLFGEIDSIWEKGGAEERMRKVRFGSLTWWTFQRLLPRLVLKATEVVGVWIHSSLFKVIYSPKSCWINILTCLVISSQPLVDQHSLELAEFSLKIGLYNTLSPLGVIRKTLLVMRGENWGYPWPVEWPLIGHFAGGSPARLLPSHCLLPTPVMQYHPTRMFCSPRPLFQWVHTINKASRCQSWSTFSQ